MERLQKIMAACGIASRRKCEELILSGKVRVNGATITQLGFKVDPSVDEIEVNGQRIYVNEEKVYILLNKPVKVITSVHDPQGRVTVLDLIKNVRERIYPVGRLDYLTEGLLLLTNDGELAYRMTHPSYEIEKEYIVTVQDAPMEHQLNMLRNGVMLEDGLTSPADVEVLNSSLSKRCLIRIVIHEGRNRQVRRMFDYIGHQVLELKRRRIGFLTVEELGIGKYRSLTKNEVSKLKNVLKMT